MIKLSVEEQRELMRRREEAYRFEREMQILETRNQTPNERWAEIEAIQGFSELFPSPNQPFDPAEDGLVLAQARFAKIRALR